MSKDTENHGFTVTDKRLFREDGQIREEVLAEGRQGEKKPDTPPAAESPKAGPELPPGTAPPIDFPSYILSYYTQGLVFLGEVPNPITKQNEPDLESAKHAVDVLGMLHEKTKGNLSAEESQLLESVLYELRMKFMAKTNRIRL